MAIQGNIVCEKITMGTRLSTINQLSKLRTRLFGCDDKWRALEKIITHMRNERAYNYNKEKHRALRAIFYLADLPKKKGQFSITDLTLEKKRLFVSAVNHFSLVIEFLPKVTKASSLTVDNSLHIATLRTELFGYPDDWAAMEAAISTMQSAPFDLHQENNRALSALFYLAKIPKMHERFSVNELTLEQKHSFISALDNLRAVIHAFPQVTMPL